MLSLVLDLPVQCIGYGHRLRDDSLHKCPSIDPNHPICLFVDCMLSVRFILFMQCACYFHFVTNYVYFTFLVFSSKLLNTYLYALSVKFGTSFHNIIVYYIFQT